VTHFKATPHKDRLTALLHICLHIFRHISQILLGKRQLAVVVFSQSDEKSDFASAQQSLCGVALNFCTPILNFLSVCPLTFFKKWCIINV
jgi:hypothetical protein